MKLYVGNLAYRTDEAGLRAAFEQFGTVSQVAVIMDRELNRSKGFGFVEMPNDAEARDAIEKMDNQQLDGRSIRVNEARAPQPRGDRGPRRY